MRLETLVSGCVLLALGWATLVCHAQGADAGSPPVQSQPSFEAAIANHSTSPSYVSISVVDDNTGQSRTFCTTANFLMGAIHREHGIAYGRDDIARADAIAVASTDHVFHFRKREALDNMSLRYSDEELAAAKRLLAPLSEAALASGFASLYKNRRVPTDGYNRDAIACALMERGLSPQQDDMSGQVYIPRFDNRTPQ